MSWYILALKKYAQFSGRSRRKEYWMFFLFNIIFSSVAYIIDYIIFGDANVISVLYILVLFLPGLALAVRRLHDTEKGWWWIFITLIPIVGNIIFLVIMCTNGTQGVNKYGADPKENETNIEKGNIFEDKNVGIIDNSLIKNDKERTKYCPFCGAKLPADAQFCKNCGRKV